MSDPTGDSIDLHDLRVEYLTEPLAVPADHPRFSWRHSCPQPDCTQAGYRVTVSDSRGQIWDSGEQLGSDSAQIACGAQLHPLTRYEWSVTVSCSHGRHGKRSAALETGPGQDHWSRSQWITRRRPQDQHDDHRPAVYLRCRFELRQPLARARLYVTAGGLIQPIINGEPVSASTMFPGWTDYHQRVPYHAIDITPSLRRGTNTIGMVLADGWYAGGVGPFHLRNHWGKHPVVRALILLAHPDGEIDLMSTDGSWTAAFGPIRSADLLQGVVYDARHRTPDWNGDDGWLPVTVEQGPQGRLVPARMPPAAPVDPVPAVGLAHSQWGDTIVDFGQNVAGVIRAELDQPVGQIIRIRHGETLDAAGNLYTDNLRGARATDTFLSAGEPATYQPPFTYHGFRYAEITGAVGDLHPGQFAAVPISSVPAMTGEFTCSDQRLNAFHRNVQWTMRANFLEVPTDCPSRDERMGWTGDAQIFAPAAIYNADVAAFFTKWLEDIRDAAMDNGALPDVAPYQPLAWGREGSSGYAEAGVVIPWQLYQSYGDSRVLADSFDTARGWVDYITARAPLGIWDEDRNTDYGDWLAFEPTPKNLTATAYYAHAADLTARFAEVLGRNAEREQYQRLFLDIGSAFRERFVNHDGTMPVDTQTAYALALRFGLLEPHQRGGAARALANSVTRAGHITCGFLGVSHLLPTLLDTGRADLAYRLLLHDGYPSWLHQVAQGATTVWERWDGWRPETGFQDPLMNSFNHFALGSVDAWLYSAIGGITPSAPGYRTITIAPQVEYDITAARTSIETIRGRVTTDWSVVGGRCTLVVEVPANATAQVQLPGTPATDALEPDPSASRPRSIANLGSGTHELTVHLPD